MRRWISTVFSPVITSTGIRRPRNCPARQVRVRILAAGHHPEESRVLHDSDSSFGRKLVKPAWHCETIDEETHGRLVIAGSEGITRRVMDATHEIFV